MVRLGAVALVACIFVLAFFTSSSSAGKGPMVTDVVSESVHITIYICKAHCILHLWLFHRFISISPSATRIRE